APQAIPRLSLRDALPIYSGPLFTSGYSFNVPTAESYNAYDEEDLRRDIAILDIEAWASATGATYGEGYKHTGYFNRKYLPRERRDRKSTRLNSSHVKISY